MRRVRSLLQRMTVGCRRLLQRNCKLQGVKLQLQELEMSGGTKKSHLSAARHEATQAGVSFSPCLSFFLSMSFFLSLHVLFSFSLSLFLAAGV